MTRNEFVKAALQVLKYIPPGLLILGSILYYIDVKFFLPPDSFSGAFLFSLTFAVFLLAAVLSKGRLYLVLPSVVLGGLLFVSWEYFYNIVAFLEGVNNPYLNLDPVSDTKSFFLWGMLFALLPLLLAFKKADGFVPMFPARIKDGGVEICRDKETKGPVVVSGLDRYLGTMVVGPPGTGKTTRVVKRMILQDLKRLKKGEKLGITVVEPKGDLVSSIAEICDAWRIPYVYVDPEREDTARFNPLQGDEKVAAEATRTVLKNIFGRQEAFFSLVQETAARNTVLLLKRLMGDRLDITDVARVLRDPALMKKYVLELEKKEGETDLVQYFKHEVLGENADKYNQFAMGLRMQLEDLSGNKLLSRVLHGQSDIDMDRHLADGGVLLVNTAMGRLGKLGDTFGQFVVMHLQYAVFRRPGNEFTRIPHYLYIDELPRYLNPYFSILLEIGRSYRCAVTVAFQNTNQLDLERAGDYRNVILNGIRNIVVFGGLKADDAKRFEEEFGFVETEEKTPSYDYQFLRPHLFPDSYRVQARLKPRFDRTFIKELPQFHCLYRIVRNGQEQKPAVGFCPFPKVPKAEKKESVLAKRAAAQTEEERPKFKTAEAPTKEDFWG